MYVCKKKYIKIHSASVEELPLGSVLRAVLDYWTQILKAFCRCMTPGLEAVEAAWVLYYKQC